MNMIPLLGINCARILKMAYILTPEEAESVGYEPDKTYGGRTYVRLGIPPFMIDRANGLVKFNTPMLTVDIQVAGRLAKVMRNVCTIGQEVHLCCKVVGGELVQGFPVGIHNIIFGEHRTMKDRIRKANTLLCGHWGSEVSEWDLFIAQIKAKKEEPFDPAEMHHNDCAVVPNISCMWAVLHTVRSSQEDGSVIWKEPKDASIYTYHKLYTYHRL